MTPQEQPRPSDATIIRIQQQTINELSDGRVFLIALLEDTKAEASGEISRLLGEIMRLEGLLSSDNPAARGE